MPRNLTPLSAEDAATTLRSLSPEEYAAWGAMRFDEQEHYLVSRKNGGTHRFAEMLATRSFPATRTDVEFNKGRCNGNQFESVPGLGNTFREMAEAAGVSTTGKYYQHGLAEYPGDPEAWVGSRADVVAVAKKKGMKVSGMVEYDPGERAPMEDVEIAPDLVDRDVALAMTAHPGRAAGGRRGDGPGGPDRPERPVPTFVDEAA